MLRLYIMKYYLKLLVDVICCYIIYYCCAGIENTGWDDCGREFFIVFLWFSDQDSWVSFWDTAEVKNWRPWQLLRSSCICRCFMMFCWFMLILLYFIHFYSMSLKNIEKHLKTHENNWTYYIWERDRAIKIQCHSQIFPAWWSNRPLQHDVWHCMANQILAASKIF